MNSKFTINNIDFIYQNNEAEIGGFFPLGANGCWHGGIHLHYELNEGVFPLLSSKLIAYKIQEKEISCVLSDTVSTETINNFEFIYNNKHEKIRLSDCYKNDEKNNCRTVKDEYKNLEFLAGSGNYFLFKNELELSTKSTLNFYTLYMHITPYKKYLLSNKQCIFAKKDEKKDDKFILLSNINDLAKKYSPFYINWGISLESKEKLSITCLNEKDILPSTPFSVTEKKYFYHDFDTSGNIKVKLENKELELPANTLIIPNIKDLKFKFKDDKESLKFLYKKIEDIDDIYAKPPLYTKDYSGDLSNGIRNTNSKLHPEYIQLSIKKSNVDKNAKDDRKIFEIGFLPKAFITKTKTNRDCYLRYPIKLNNTGSTKLPAKFIKVYNKKVYLNNKYVQYPSGSIGETIIFPTKRVELTIKQKSYESELYEVGIKRMNIYIHKDDIENFNFDSETYKIKNTLLHHVYLYDDTKKKYRVSFTDSVNEKVDATMELTKSVLFGDSFCLCGKEFVSANYKENSSTGKQAKKETDSYDYVRIEFKNEEASFWITKKEIELKEGIIDNEKNIIVFENIPENKMKTKIYKQLFNKDEYLILNNKLCIEEVSENVLEEIPGAYNDFSDNSFEIYSMTASEFLYSDTEITINKTLISEEKNKETWEKIFKNSDIELILYPTREYGNFYINEEQITTEIKGTIAERNENNKTNYKEINDAVFVYSDENMEYPSSYITLIELRNKKLSKVPEVIAEKKLIISERNAGVSYLKIPENSQVYISNEFDETIIQDKLNKELTQNDCLGTAGMFMGEENFIHLSLFTDKDIEKLDFEYNVFKDKRIKLYQIKEHLHEEYEKKNFMLTSHQIIFDIDESSKILDFAKVQIKSMDFYIHEDDMHSLLDNIPSSEHKKIKSSKNFCEEFCLKSSFTKPVYLYDIVNKIDFSSKEEPSNKGLVNIKKYFLNNGSGYYNTYCGVKQNHLGEVKTSKTIIKEDIDSKTNPALKGYYCVTLNNKTSKFFWANIKKIKEEYNSKSKSGKQIIFDIGRINATNMPNVDLYDCPDYSEIKAVEENKIKIPHFVRNVFEKSLIVKEGGLYKEKKMYYAFSANGQDYYIDKQTYNDTLNKKINLKDFFTLPDEDKKKDLKCDIGSFFEALFNKGSDAVRAGKKKGMAEIMHNENYAKAKEILRALVCKFPFEWDKQFYTDDQKEFWQQNMDILDEEYSVLQKIMEQSDIKSDLNKINELKGKEEFYHYNPGYFLGKMNELGLINPHAEELKRVQERVLKMKTLVKNGPGIFNQWKGKNVTFCNDSTFLIIRAVDENYKNFTGGKECCHPDSIEDLKKDMDVSIKDEYKNGKRPSNIWCDILKYQCNKGKLIEIKEPERAQFLANEGRVVIVCWKNPGLTDIDSPHYATIMPGYKYDKELGCMIANVGYKNGKFRVKEKAAFGDKQPLHYYMNSEPKYRRDSFFSVGGQFSIQSLENRDGKNE